MDRGIRHGAHSRDPVPDENELRFGPRDRSMLRRVQGLAAAFTILLPTTDSNAAEGDAVRGEGIFQRCYACHSVDPHETAKLQGPTLYRVIGRPAAAIAGFEYSGALKMKGAAGLVWDAVTLDAYLADPEGFVPGTLMSVPPLRDDQERAALMAYLARSGSFKP